jgi:hypothetical protein
MMKLIAILIAAVALAAAGCGSSKTQELSRDVVSKPGHGADKDSLFRSANFAKALDALSDKANGQKLLLFKLESASIKSMVTDGKSFTNIIVTKEFHATDIGGAGVTTGDPFAISTVGADAPEKIVKALASKGITLKDVDYFTVLGQGRKTSLELFTLDNKGIYQADLDGSNVHALGTLPNTSGGGSSGSSIQDCVAKAGTDANAIAKCATGG